MNAKSEIHRTSPLDKVKIVLAIAIVVGGVAGYYIYEDAPAVARIGAVIFSLAVAIGVFMRPASAASCGSSSRARASSCARSSGRTGRKPGRRRW
jgi:hypothetical protein